MRLTLRTLLAYLDNTLDAQDAESLKSKLAESGFATQLVDRIRGTLGNGSLPAPSPEAVAPVADANEISEYLDSTLPAEQVAEIERACLESDSHLAEAAACHQILTMVLGKPAEVSPELRARIYELPDKKIEDIAVAGSFSSVAIPVDQPQLGPLSDDLPTADGALVREGHPIKPVGVSDSGVSDAPTRLREAESADAQRSGGAEAAFAGSKPRSADDTVIYTGPFRPSRIAPWLVSLALAAVLLFVLTRIFQPLFDRPSASLDPDLAVAPSAVADGTETAEPGKTEIEVPADQSPVMEQMQPAAAEVARQGDDAEALPAPGATPAADASPPVTKAGDGDASAGTGASLQTQTDVMATAAEERADRVETRQEPSSSASEPEMAETSSADDLVVEAAPPVPAPPAPQPPASTSVMQDADQPPPAQDVAQAAKKELAKVTSPKTLLAGLVGGQWVRLTKDMMVVDGLQVACAPTFRGHIETDEVDLTMVGPAQVQWLVGDQGQVTLALEYGRVLVMAKKAGATLQLRLGQQVIGLSYDEAAAVAAVSLQHFRAPGFDPLRPESRIPLTRVLSVQGSVGLLTDQSQDTLDTALQWVKRGSAAAAITPLEAAPDWIDPPDPGASTLEASARSGLLELLEGDQPLEITLRESTLFRRSEVGALAAQTLLVLGRGDVYFGGDGVLSEPKQRAYWPDHFKLLLETVDRSAESAQAVSDSIEKMDSANFVPLLRLLTGYSQKQLVEGGDQELVELLDSSSMAVRVLALENLHKITGTTLYFRAEQDNAVRRAPVIKKWIARQRKGDIRWQD